MSKISNLRIILGEFSLEIPFLELLDQGITAISGPSGSGKTTLFRVMMGVYQPKSYSWLFKDQDLSKLTISDRRLGVAFQGDELFPHLTAKENVMLVARSRRADISKLNEYVDRLRISKVWLTKAALLSGGEKQRVSLLRAFISDSRAILLDEPFSALDNVNRVEARTLVKELVREFNVPAFLISHDEEDIHSLVDKVIRLREGRVV